MRSILVLCVLVGVGTPIQAQGGKFLGRNVTSWAADLKSSDEQIRRSAAFALGKFGEQGTGAILPLKLCLKTDSSAKVREAAMSALGEIGRNHIQVRNDRDIAVLLTKGLDDSDFRVRRSAAFALGCIQHGEAQPILQRLLENDAKAEVRQSAAGALGKLEVISIASLKAGLADADAGVRRETLSALEPLAKRNPERFRGDKQLLLNLASDPEDEIRKMALALAASILEPGDSSALAPLTAALRDSSYEVRRPAALALAKVGGDGVKLALPVLLQILKDPDPHFRLIAALQIGQAGELGEPAVPTLVELLGNLKETAQIRKEAGVALSRIGNVPKAEKVVGDLVKILTNSSDDPAVRERVLWALRVHRAGLRNFDSVKTALTQVLSEAPDMTNHMLRYDCAYMLGLVYRDEVPAKTFDVLLEFLRNPEILVYTKRTSSFSASGSEKGGANTKIDEQGKGDGRVMAVQALSAIGDRTRQYPAILTELRKLAKSSDYPPLREDCVKLLRELGE